MPMTLAEYAVYVGENATEEDARDLVMGRVEYFKSQYPGLSLEGVSTLANSVGTERARSDFAGITNALTANSETLIVEMRALTAATEANS